MSALTTAILAGEIQAVRELATSQPDLLAIPAFDGLLPLQLAYRKGRSDILLALLRAQAPGAERTPDFAQLLIDYIRELCGDVAFAGWLTDIEYDLWHILTTGMAVDEDRYQLSEQIETLADLRFLSERCRGWVRYAEHGPTYVPLNEWRHHFSAWQQRHEEP
jgi:hypothetical protein